MTLSDEEIIGKLQNLSGNQFERFISELWERRDWDTHLTTRANDKGIDIIATCSVPYEQKELIQAKCYTQGNRVGRPELQQYASLYQQEANVDNVVVVTTSGFTDGALSTADQTNVKCIDGGDLAQMITSLEATDLVEEYCSESDVSEPVELRGSNSSREQGGLQTNESITLRDNTKMLAVEVTGAQRGEVEIYQSGFLADDIRAQGIFFSLKLYGQGELGFALDTLEVFELIDERGNKYTPLDLGKKDLTRDLKKHGRTDTIDILGGDMVKCVVGFGLPDGAKPSKLKIKRCEAEIDFDYKSRQRLPSLPSEVASELYL